MMQTASFETSRGLGQWNKDTPTPTSAIRGRAIDQSRLLPDAVPLDTIASLKGLCGPGRHEGCPAGGEPQGGRSWANRRASHPGAPAASHWWAPISAERPRFLKPSVRAPAQSAAKV